MKIEKINDNQIRCTLTKEDLELRNLHLSELAYGTEKAKKLFREMMQQAQDEFGFAADNLPLMIEAIPLNTESILLIVTKVEDPEELDTRFSKFSPFKNNEIEELLHLDGADSIIDLFQKLMEAKGKPALKKPSSPEGAAVESLEPGQLEASLKESRRDTLRKAAQEAPIDLIQIFRFPSLDDSIRAARALDDYFEGRNSLYKDKIHQDYCLILHQSGNSPENFNRICNTLSEYGSSRSFSAAGEAHLSEHAEIILANNAIGQLASL